MSEMKTREKPKAFEKSKTQTAARTVIAAAAVYSDFRTAYVFRGAAFAAVFVLALLYSLAALYFQYYSRNIGGHFQLYALCALLAGLYVSYLIYHLTALIAADILWAVLKGVTHRNIPHRFFSAAACISGILITIYGRRHANDLVTVRYDVRNPKYKEKREYRIVQLSDLHIGAIIRTDYIRKVVERTNALRPDLVVLTGDEFNRNAANENEELGSISHEIAGISAPDGVFAIRGNHDPDPENPAWQQFLSQGHVRDLDNVCVADGPVNLAGRPGLAKDGGRVSLDELLRDANPEKMTVLLEHDPMSVREAQEEKTHPVDLVLSGHTHNGQFFPATLVTRFWYGKDYCHGMHEDESGTVSVVSAGAGYFQTPVRVGSDSEIVLICVTGGTKHEPLNGYYSRHRMPD